MSSKFCAQEPNLGYLYQIRYGLMLLLNEEADDAFLLIENIDDISIESSSGLDVYQTKFHLNNPPNITNASADFWKTIRVWSEMILNNQITLEKTIFSLITTAAAGEESILSNLTTDRIPTRNVDSILKDMQDVINASQSITNKASYSAFQNLSESQQKKLITNIIVVDSSADINKTKAQILLKLRIVSKNFESLFERLEGWFLGQVINQLQGLRVGIAFQELQQVIWDIADTLKADNLPADFNSSIAGDESQLSPYRARPFVKQLELIDIPSNAINHAISDYHRAFSQASKWIREGLLSPADQIAYHAKLHEDWDRKFSVLCNKIEGEEASNTILRGKSFYLNFYVTTYPSIHIKDRFKETYMITGSCQMLSNDKKIGWHPNFETII